MKITHILKELSTLPIWLFIGMCVVLSGLFIGGGIAMSAISGCEARCQEARYEYLKETNKMTLP